MAEHICAYTHTQSDEYTHNQTVPLNRVPLHVGPHSNPLIDGVDLALARLAQMFSRSSSNSVDSRRIIQAGKTTFALVPCMDVVFQVWCVVRSTNLPTRRERTTKGLNLNSLAVQFVIWGPSDPVNVRLPLVVIIVLTCSPPLRCIARLGSAARCILHDLPEAGVLCGAQQFT